MGHADGLRLLHRPRLRQAGIPFCWSAIPPPTWSGYDTTVPISVDELIPLVRGVVRGARTRWWWPTCRSAATRRPAQALATATRFLKETGAHAVKLGAVSGWPSRSPP